MSFKLSARAKKLTSSAIREMLKLTERPGMISFAGGLPAPATFPIARLREASAAALQAGPAALQYSPTEGYGPLREWIAAYVSSPRATVSPDNVLITSGSQQAIDLLGKALIDAGQPVLLETPTYVGAMQALSVFEPSFVPVASDEDGPLPADLVAHRATGASFLYLVPNFQNPTGRQISAPRRQALVEAAATADVPLVEDDPYRELRFTDNDPPTLLSLAPDRVAHLGSFSKVLAPGLRVGYVVAPSELHRKLVQAKQGADLHTSSLTQRVVHEAIKDGFFAAHVHDVRALYAARCRAMLAALAAHFPPQASWQAPAGGMFVWITLPPGLDSMALLQRAVEDNVAFLPGVPFYAANPATNMIRLSFATPTEEQIAEGVARLGRLLRQSIGNPQV